MSSNLWWFGPSRGELTEQIERLRLSLELLGRQLRERIAEEIGQTVACSVRDGVRSLLNSTVVSSTRQTPPSGRPLSRWNNSEESRWSDPREDELARGRWDEDYWDDPEDAPMPPAARPSPSLWPRVLALLGQGLLWCLHGRSQWLTFVLIQDWPGRRGKALVVRLDGWLGGRGSKPSGAERCGPLRRHRTGPSRSSLASPAHSSCLVHLSLPVSRSAPGPAVGRESRKRESKTRAGRRACARQHKIVNNAPSPERPDRSRRSIRNSTQLQEINS